MDFLLILLILFIIAMVVTTLLYVYDSRFEFVKSTWGDVRAWFKSGKNQTYVIAGAVMFVVMLVLVFFIRRANHKHSRWIKSHDKFIEMEDTWLTNVRLIKTDGVKGLNKKQLAKFKKEVEENEKDIRTIEHIIEDRKTNPGEYRSLSRQQKVDENDFISATRKDITQRNEAMKGFLVRNEKKLGKSAAKIAKNDIKESQKLATKEINTLKKNAAAATSLDAVSAFEERIRDLEDEKEVLKQRLNVAQELKPLVMDMAVPLMDVSELIDKIEEGGESTFESMEDELAALDMEFNSLLHGVEEKVEEDIVDPLERRYEELQREEPRDMGVGELENTADHQLERMEVRV